MSQSNIDKNQLVLGCGAIRGFVEPIRLVLRYTRTPYREKLYELSEGSEYSGEEWLSEKEKLGLDFPNLPYLFDGDLKISQSKPILYYLGDKLNLMGKTPSEKTHVMMLCEDAHDLRLKSGGLFIGPNGDSKEEIENYPRSVVFKHLKRFDDYFGKNNTKFAVGDQATVADFQLYEYIQHSLSLYGGDTLLDKYPNVKRFLKTIRELPEIKDYIAKAHFT